jgi:hypothetical protein
VGPHHSYLLPAAAPHLDNLHSASQPQIKGEKIKCQRPHSEASNAHPSQTSLTEASRGGSDMHVDAAAARPAMALLHPAWQQH